MEKIFISYSRTDEQFVNQLAQGLKMRGHGLWLDTQNINAGAAWREEISKAIRDCSAFILVLTQNSQKSTSVIRELSIAETHRRYIIPVLYGIREAPPAMEYQIADLQRIYFSDLTFDKALAQLDSALQAQPSSPVAPPQNEPRSSSPGKTTWVPATQTPRRSDSSFGSIMAMTTLALGLVNLCAWTLPVAGISLSLGGIVTGVLGLNSNRRTMAIIGLILCLLGLSVSCVYSIWGSLLTSGY